MAEPLSHPQFWGWSGASYISRDEPWVISIDDATSSPAQADVVLLQVLPHPTPRHAEGIALWMRCITVLPEPCTDDRLAYQGFGDGG